MRFDGKDESPRRDFTLRKRPSGLSCFPMKLAKIRGLIFLGMPQETQTYHNSFQALQRDFVPPVG